MLRHSREAWLGLESGPSEARLGKNRAGVGLGRGRCSSVARGVARAFERGGLSTVRAVRAAEKASAARRSTKRPYRKSSARQRTVVRYAGRLDGWAQAMRDIRLPLQGDGLCQTALTGRFGRPAGAARTRGGIRERASCGCRGVHVILFVRPNCLGPHTSIGRLSHYLTNA